MLLNLFAVTLADAAQLSSPVGVCVAAYLLWERWSKRRTESRKEQLANDEQQIKIEGMATAAITAAYDELMRVRKAAHDTDIANLKLEIGAAKHRLAELETRETACQRVCAGLQKQNTEQAVEILELRAKIEGLEAKLRAAGALPGSGSHTPHQD